MVAETGGERAYLQNEKTYTPYDKDLFLNAFKCFFRNNHPSSKIELKEQFCSFTSFTTLIGDSRQTVLPCKVAKRANKEAHDHRHGSCVRGS